VQPHHANQENAPGWAGWAVLALAFLVVSSCGDGFVSGGSLDESSQAAREALTDTVQAVVPGVSFDVDTSVSGALCPPDGSVAADHWVRVAVPDEVEDLDSLVEEVRDHWADWWDLDESDLWFRLNSDISAVEVRLDYFKIEFSVFHEARSIHVRAFTGCYASD
jgi:hypothetical protein